MPKGDIKYHIPEDEDEQSPQVELTMDAESDLKIQQDTGVLMLSLPQAYAMHKALGQLLIRHQRSWGGATKPTLRLV